MKESTLKKLSLFNFVCMVMILLGSGVIVVKAETIAQWLKNGIYCQASAITPTSGAVPVANGTSFVSSTTPAISLSSASGLPISTGVSGLGTGVATALGVNIGSAGAFTTFNGAHGTPSSITLTNATGLPMSSVTGGTNHRVATYDASGLTVGVAPGTSGNVLTSNGTDWASAAASSGAGGLAVFGNGADGVVNFDGTNTYAGFATTSGSAPNFIYTMTRDIYPSTLTVASGKTLKSSNFRIFCSGVSTISGTISTVGNAAAGGTGGAGNATGLLAQGAAGGNSATAGTNANSSAGGVGGTGGTLANGGTAAAPTAANGGIQILQAMPYASTGCVTLSSGFIIGAGAGGGGGASSGGTGGGGGGGGGPIILCTKTIAGSGSLSAKGGAGANGVGGNASGGGGGGAGWIVVITSSSSLGTVTTDVTGGALGTHVGTGTDGGTGGTGNVFFIQN